MAKGIYKRGGTYWMRYAGLDGKMRFESSKTTSFKDAEALLILRKNEIREGKDPMPKRRMLAYTFNELAEHYSKWAEIQKGFKKNKYVIEILLKEYCNIPLKHFSVRLVEEFQAKIIAKGNKPATSNRYLSTLKAMFTKAVEWEMADEEILKKVRKVKLLPMNNRRLRYLSKEECQALINACDKHLKPIVITALNTGMRRGEILSLRWDKNIDLKHGFILLDITKNGERREIPINDTLRATFKGIQRRLDIPYVFFDPITGNPYQEVKRSFPSACRRAGIRDFRFHDLRHTFASHLVMAGVDITTVSRLLGHKSLTMTLRYSHLAPSHMIKAVNMLDNAINGRPTIQKLYNSTGKEVVVNA